MLKSIEFLTFWRFCIDFYNEFASPLVRPAASADHRPSIKTARTPTDKSVWGTILNTIASYYLMSLLHLLTFLNHIGLYRTTFAPWRKLTYVNTLSFCFLFLWTYYCFSRKHVHATRGWRIWVTSSLVPQHTMARVPMALKYGSTEISHSTSLETSQTSSSLRISLFCILALAAFWLG